MNREKLHRRAVESRYDAVCSIYEYGKVKDETTKLTKHTGFLVAEKIACHMSHTKIKAADGQGAAVGKEQGIMLYIPPDIPIKAGTLIKVTQQGITRTYKNSGEPAVYASHQEIPMELSEEWT